MKKKKAVDSFVQLQNMALDFARETVQGQNEDLTSDIRKSSRKIASNKRLLKAIAAARKAVNTPPKPFPFPQISKKQRRELATLNRKMYAGTSGIPVVTAVR